MNVSWVSVKGFRYDIRIFSRDFLFRSFSRNSFWKFFRHVSSGRHLSQDSLIDYYRDSSWDTSRDSIWDSFRKFFQFSFRTVSRHSIRDSFRDNYSRVLSRTLSQITLVIFINVSWVSIKDSSRYAVRVFSRDLFIDFPGIVSRISSGMFPPVWKHSGIPSAIATRILSLISPEFL